MTTSQVLMIIVVIQASQAREIIDWGLRWQMERGKLMSGMTLTKPRITNIREIVISHEVENGESKCTQKANNRRAHAINGNRMMTVMQLNKGSSHFPNKAALVMDEVKKFGPSIVNICEANYKKSDKDLHGDLVNYSVEMSKQSERLGHSRNIMLIKKDIVYKRRKDLENNS